MYEGAQPCARCSWARLLLGRHVLRRALLEEVPDPPLRVIRDVDVYSPAKVKAASNSSVLLMKFVLAATFADSIARRSFPVGGAALTTCKLLREEDDRF